MQITVLTLVVWFTKPLAALVAGLIVGGLSAAGMETTAEQKTALTVGIYGFVTTLINRRFNPGNTASVTLATNLKAKRETLKASDRASRVPPAI